MSSSLSQSTSRSSSMLSRYAWLTERALRDWAFYGPRVVLLWSLQSGQLTSVSLTLVVVLGAGSLRVALGALLLWCVCLHFLWCGHCRPASPLPRRQQGSLSDRTSKAFFSQLMLTCGCQCASIRPAPGATKVVPVGDGKCEVVEDTSSHHRCDYMGGHWCDTVTSARYVFTGKDQSCGRQPSVVQRQLSTYEPSKSFGRVPT